ncbi:TVP38/TMEM64 family protein [Rhodococcus hoagii]|nr:TVP38/TMEM64 family protein [Prescottella equi]
MLGALVGLAVVRRRGDGPAPVDEQIRSWAESGGTTVPSGVFLLVHVVVTIAPVPRTLFTVSAGVLFGAATGIAVTMAATTISAVLALLIVRAIGRGRRRRASDPSRSPLVDARLERRGWLASAHAPDRDDPVLGGELLCGVSSVRVLPYTLATVAGDSARHGGRGLLGDALTGETDPRLLVVSGICIAVGMLGLFVDARTPLSTDAHSWSSSRPGFLKVRPRS